MANQARASSVVAIAFAAPGIHRRLSGLGRKIADKPGLERIQPPRLIPILKCDPLVPGHDDEIIPRLDMCPGPLVVSKKSDAFKMRYEGTEHLAQRSPLRQTNAPHLRNALRSLNRHKAILGQPVWVNPASPDR